MREREKRGGTDLENPAAGMGKETHLEGFEPPTL